MDPATRTLPEIRCHSQTSEIFARWQAARVSAEAAGSADVVSACLARQATAERELATTRANCAAEATAKLLVLRELLAEAPDVVRAIADGLIVDLAAIG